MGAPYIDEDSRLVCDQQRLWIRFQRENGIKISRSLFSKIIREGNRLKGEALVSVDGYKMEYGGSYMYVQKYKSKKMYPNYKVSKEYSTFIPHTNNHSLGYNFCFKWSNDSDLIPNMRLMVFQPFRDIKQALKRNIIGGQMNYSTLTTTERRQIKKLEKLMKKTKSSGENNRSSQYYI